MAHFDEHSGIIEVRTPWGHWWQTLEEVYIEVNVAEGTRGKEVKVIFTTRSLKCEVRGEVVFEGALYGPVIADDSTWTIEDRRLVRIMLAKCPNVKESTVKTCWRSLLKDCYEADPFTYDKMEQKLTLQRFQLENPGMNFSNAKVTGNYQDGGPVLPDY
ncbi:PREDICTED: nudC domain-containing protein 2-like [Priapulus caudatus]|uniref:NudC domain-containing protein 2-like n=1 Tax=Priapulus caudatus TaxID=37621 RepID=A0ABM1F9P0_PRICU|nr:PREDICTED: nudC domain-containing protein 2-like [Priapulus caudatus]